MAHLDLIVTLEMESDAYLIMEHHAKEILVINVQVWMESTQLMFHTVFRLTILIVFMIEVFYAIRVDHCQDHAIFKMLLLAVKH